MKTTNTIRAERFGRMLRTYNSGDSNKERLIDLLADARHWCDRHDLSHGGIDRLAYSYYLAERGREKRS